MAGLQPGEFVELASGVYLEGLAVDHARGAVWYSDVIGGGVHGLMPDGSRTVFDADRMWTGGIMMNADGAVLSSGQGGIRWNHPDSGRSGWLIDRIDGVPVNGINEMAPDGQGGIYFGTVDLDNVIAGKATRPTAIYHLRQDRSLACVAPRLGFTNGIVHDIERRALYCSETFHCAHRWTVEEDGSLSDHAVLAERADCDGMALDADGNVLITSVDCARIDRLSPKGEPLDPIKGPMDGCITQIRFGSDGRDFWIACGTHEAVQALKDGSPLSGRMSRLFRGRSERPGALIGPADFEL